MAQTTGLPTQIERPLVATPAVDPFSDAQRDAVAAATAAVPGIPANDLTFVPGYSDRRTEKEIARGKGERGPTLSHRFHLVRTKRPSGAPDMRKAFEFRAKGYVPVKADQLTSYGIQMPPAGVVDANGEIIVGDTTLYACTAKQAMKNEKDWRRATDQAAADSDARAAAGGVEVSSHEQVVDNVGPSSK